MILLQPTWISHDGNPIYSIDIHPDLSRVATGGGDTKVKIWSMSPVKSAKAEAQSTKGTKSGVQRLLCSRESHLGSVACVRWSPNGQYLATASDDRTIKLWSLQAAARGSLAALGSGDCSVENWEEICTLRGHAMDVTDVSWMDSRTLISCSIDSKVIVWDVTANKKLHILSEHTGPVKGIAVDPIGKYFATASDDKSVIVWRLADGKPQHVMKDPFSQTSDSTFFRRMSWSPEGSNLCATHARNGGKHIAPIFERSSWKTHIDFVGHTKPVVSARFNPTIFRTKKKGKEYAICAIGSVDCRISVWTTSLPKPAVIIDNVFNQCVLDISWSSSGYAMMACSSEGKVVYVEFDESELGQAVSGQRKNEIIETLYGSAINGAAPSAVIEDPDLVPNANAEIVPIEEERIPSTKEAVHLPLATSASLSNVPVTPLSTPSLTRNIREAKARDGRRRITPLLLDHQVGMSSSASPFISPTLSTSTSFKSAPSSATNTPHSTTSNRAFASPMLAQTAKRRRDQDEESRGRKKQIRVHKVPAEIVAQTVGKEKFILSERVGESLLTCDIIPDDVVDMGTSPVVVAARKVGPLNGIVRCSRNGETLWEEWITSLPCCVAAGSNFVAVSGKDGSIDIFSVRGVRQLPTIMAGSPLAFLKAFGQQLLAVTCGCEVYLWDVKRVQCMMKESIRPVLRGPDKQIIHVSLTPGGWPVVTTEFLNAFAWEPKLQVWVKISDGQFARSDFMSSMSFRPPKKEGPLQRVQRESLREAQETEILSIQSPQNYKLETISHLGYQVKAAEVMNSASEYKFWLTAYVRRLCESGAVDRLRSICAELLGPGSIPADESTKGEGGWSPTVLGLNKHAVLESVLMAMKQFTALQRLILEFQTQLKERSSATGNHASSTG